MELIPLRYGYRLNIGSHSMMMSKQDLDELVQLLTGDGAKASNVGGKRRYVSVKELMQMAVGEYTVIRMKADMITKTCSTLNRCQKKGGHFTFQVVGGRKMPDDDPDAERDYLITRIK